MRIGIDARMYSSAYTGIGRYVYELIKRLPELDRKNEYVIFMNEPEFHELDLSSPRFSKVLVNAKHYSLKEQTKYLFALNRAKLDLVHFTHFNAPLLYRRPSLVTIHDLTLSFFPGKKMNSAFYRFAYRRVLNGSVHHAKKVISVSKNTKQDLIDLTHVSPSKVEVIYNGVGEQFGPREDRESVLDMVKKYNITKDFLLYTGVWRSHKNLVNLIRAFHRLHSSGGFDAQLVITGKEDPFYPEVKRTVQELGLEHDVIFPGHVDEDELVALYQASTLYVFPSLYEGFGLPPLEAMRCGTPVAASKRSCLPEICGDSNAIFFDPYDPEDIAMTIQKVWLNEPLREELREKGLRHSRKFSWDETAKKTVEIYKDILTK